MTNPVFEAVRTVLAVREYSDQPLSEESLQRIVEAGRLTASSINRQPWHFVLVTDRGLLSQLGQVLKSGPYVAGAGAAVVVGIERESPFGVSDGSRAMQSMILTAWGEGIGSNWVGFGNIPSAAELVGLPDHYTVLAVVPFGYPRRALGKGRKKRKPLAEVVSLNRFETPLEPSEG